MHMSAHMAIHMSLCFHVCRLANWIQRLEDVERLTPANRHLKRLSVTTIKIFTSRIRPPARLSVLLAPSSSTSVLAPCPVRMSGILLTFVRPPLPSPRMRPLQLRRFPRSALRQTVFIQSERAVWWPETPKRASTPIFVPRCFAAAFAVSCLC